ncbi:MAG: hypothetical protein NC898_00250 [Candidatus Omnitrophica bacterium]|nr:hypothetical protein [Candidatus Omnitrophota bacterium]MCM8792888.1 hypothetical protein [Candidatus Omnitrophota bacterium]
MKRLIFLFVFLNLIVSPVFSEDKEEKATSSKEESFSFQEIINKEEEKIDKENEKKILREEWKDLLHGLDIFYPYFKIKEIEEWLGEKASLEILNFKGKPKLDEDQIFYVFKMKL